MHLIASAPWNPNGGQGLRQLSELGLALVLSTLIGLEQADVQLTYRTGRGVLTRILEECTGAGFRVMDVRVEHAPWREGAEEAERVTGTTEVRLSIEGTGSVHHLVTRLAEVDGVISVWSPAGNGAY